MVAATPDEDVPLLGAQEPVTSNFWFCVVNLTKAILGVGLMALPRACCLLGLWPGVSLLALIGTLTWVTVSRGMLAAYRQALHHRQAQALLTDAESAEALSGGLASGGRELEEGQLDHFTGLVAVRMTYSDLVEVTLGPRVADILSLFLVGCTFGYSIMFINIIGDSLLGSEGLPGVLTDLVSALNLNPELAAWMLWRPLVLAGFVVFVLGPLSLKKDIATVNWLNATGLVALAAFGTSLLFLAMSAVMQGKAHAPAWGPNLPALGDDTTTRFLAILGILPILISADACHQNILPLASMQRPFSLATLDRIVAATLLIVTSFYLFISYASYTVFGDGIEEDILKNLCVPSLTPLVGPVAAAAISYTVRLGYVTSLVGSSVLNMYPLRESFSGLIFTHKVDGKSQEDKYFAPVTWFLLMLAYAIAVFIPSMWAVLTFVGSVEGTVVCFIVPGVLMIYSIQVARTQAQGEGPTSSRLWDICSQGVAVSVIVLGFAVMAARVLGPLFVHAPAGDSSHD
eukprot:gene18525-25032_t